MRGLASLAAPLLAVGVVSQAGVSGTRAVRYVANSGMLVTVDGHDVLIDAPIREGIAPYPTSSPDERRRLESARPPYDRIAAILITHWHEDHFSAEAIAAHLSANQRAVVISSPEVVGRIRAADPALAASRLLERLPRPGDSDLVRVGELAVRVLRIRHNPTRRLPGQHVGFLIGDRHAVLHVGDADPSADNFILLKGLPGVDVALLPYWYVLTPNSRRFVTQAIAPRRIVAMHLPPDEAGGLTRALEGSELHVALPGPPGQLVAVIR